MNWLDRLKGKIGRPDGPAAQGADTLQKPPDREAGSTMVRAGANPGATITKPGVRFHANHEVTVDLQIKALLGSGGMGEVYLARQRLWDADVALKIPSDEIVSDSENRHRIVREAEAWTDLGLHPHIAYCYYAQPLGELLLLAIEYVDGGNLREWIAEGRCADLKTGLDLAIQFCHGLEHAHKKGLVHRDIKPENVLLMKDGTLKITDFGIVRKAIAGSDILESAGVVRQVAAGMTTAGIGTADYMAPEQWGDQSEIDHRADVFAFGICLYEMLCGARPYLVTAGLRQEAPDPGRLRGGKGLPERLSRLMKQCVEWDRAGRPSGAQEVRAALCVAYEEAFGEPCLHAELPEISTLADDWNNRALSYLALGRGEDAEKAWRTALEADPRHLESSYNYGLHRWRGAKATDEEILASIRGVAESGPSSWLPSYLLAQVHLERGDAEGARAELAKIKGDGAAKAEVLAARRAVSELAEPSRFVRTFEGHTGYVVSVNLSADGRFMLSGSYDNTLKLWEVASGSCLRTFEGHAPGLVWSACMSADGRYALSGGSDKLLKLWEVATGRCLRVFKGHAAGVPAVCLSADGRYALSAGGEDKTIKLWDVETGQCVQTFVGHTGFAMSVNLSADGRYALSGGSDDKTLKLWELRSGACLRTFVGHTAHVMSVCLSADGRYALSGSQDHTLKLWEVTTGRCLRTFEGHANVVWSVCLSADGRFALSGGFDETVRLWETASGRCLRTFEGHTAGLVWSVRLSADGRYAVSGSNDKTGKLWQVGSYEYRGALRLALVVRSSEAISLAVQCEAGLKEARSALSAGNTVAAARSLRVVRRDPRLRRATSAVREWAKLYLRLRPTGLADCWSVWKAGHKISAKSVCLSADKKYALSASHDMTLRLWDVESGRLLRTFEGHTNFVVSVCMSADGRYALSGSNDKTIKLWEVESGRCIRTFEGHTGIVMSACLSADGRYALSGGHDMALRLWEVESGRCLRTFEGHTKLVWSGCLSVDGRYALSASWDHTLKVWEVATGKCLRTLDGHTHAVNSGCLSADGRYALSGSADKTLRLWEVATGRCLRTLDGHTGTVHPVGLSVNGRFALSGSWDQTLKLWDVENGRCLRSVEQASPVDSVCLSGDGQYALIGCGDGTVALWFLDWELEENETGDWNEGARPHLDIFLRAHQGYAATLPKDRQPTDAEVTRALTRQGRPQWSEEDFNGLLYTLGCVGYGWLRPEGVRRELEQMTAAWKEPR